MSLKIRRLTKIYPGKGAQEKALDQVQLDISQGEFVGVLGRSGAGKSTLIRCINQLVRPTEGEVLWQSTDMTQLKGAQLRLAMRDMGMIFQQFHLIPRLTVLQNCVLGMFADRPSWKNVLGTISAAEEERGLSALERVGLAQLAHRRVDRLSGGQQQRVAIARVIMQQPKLLLGDEPVASLDPVTSREVMHLIHDVHHSGKMTAVVNLHDVDLALEYCQRIIGLSQGQVVFDGPPREVDQSVLEAIYA